MASAARGDRGPGAPAQRIPSRPSHQERRRFVRLILAYAPGGRSLRKLAAEAAASGWSIFPTSPCSCGFAAAAMADASAKICWRAAMRRRRAGAQKRGPPHDASRIEGRAKPLSGALSYDVAGQGPRFPHYRSKKAKRWIAGVQPGDIAIADRGYPQPDGMLATRDAADLLVRLTWNSLNLRDGAGEPVDWLALFAKADAAGHFDMPSTVHKAAAASSRCLCGSSSRRSRRTSPSAPATWRATTPARINTTSPAHLEGRRKHACVTSLDAIASRLNCCPPLVRWQVESAFKRWKRKVLTKDSPENRSFFGEGVKVVVEVVVNPQRQIDHFDDLGDDLCATANRARKWRMLLLSCSMGTVRSLPVKSWSSGMRR